MDGRTERQTDRQVDSNEKSVCQNERPHSLILLRLFQSIKSFRNFSELLKSVILFPLL